ncbi:uncharacterized protein PAN0_047d6411 [Moesziomyces antarcticus]|uniref:Uncharacterized protein n=2 Tax=Pseudozyma antarctica TaxID=84753 RepID=A0A081CNC9_PSEA2|nr:uncharacterized protein PAN0_047d6411 [Moesziomyces antarcticus]GAK68175.1 conserved hypothetical protein [Moesziomyces antarcticus]SPO45236.1 uncharacterized protein PSANT_02922 [Moesziomyces antarcticus]
MRISSSLLVILAAISAANAAAVDSALNPKHRLVRVQKGAAHANALDAANVKADAVDLQKLQHLASVAAKRSVELSALGTAGAHVEAGRVKNVAGILHTLTASLEAHIQAAAKVSEIKDTKKATAKVNAILGHVHSTLAHGVVSVGGVKTSATHSVLGRRDLLGSLDLSVVGSLLGKVDGAEALISLLASLHLDAVLGGDVFSILANLNVVAALHDVVGIECVLEAILKIGESVTVLEAFQQLEDPVAFVQAMVQIKSVVELVATASGETDAIGKVEGGVKLAAYVAKFGSESVKRILCISGIEGVLEAIIKVPGSFKLLASLKTVTDVSGFVSGLDAVSSVTSFVASVQAVSDVTSLSGAVTGAAGITGVVGIKRELPLGVGDTVEGLDVDRMVQLKRAIAHLAALPQSGVASGVEQTAQTQAVDNAEKTVNGLDVAQLAVLKRSIAALSALSDSDIAAIDAAAKRDILAVLPVGTAGGVLGDAESTVAQIKRDVLNTADSATSSVTTIPGSILSSVDLNRISFVKRSQLLTPVQGVVSSIDADRIVAGLKRAIADADASLPSFLVKGSSVGVHERSVPAGVAGSADISVSLDLLEEVVKTLLCDIKELLCKLTEIVDSIHVDEVVCEIKQSILPLIERLALTIASSLTVKVPSIDVKLEAILQLATKTAKSLP